MFLAQEYPDKELIIIDDGDDSIADLVPEQPEIRYMRRSPRQALGAKRNFACEQARGEIILHWDDDDWYAPSRIRYQVEALLAGDFDVCGIDRVFFANPATREAWEYVYPKNQAPWVCGATLCYRKEFWQNNRFPDVSVGEDTRFVFGVRGARIGVLDDNRFFVARIHDTNTSPKLMHDRRWESRPFATIQSIAGSEWLGAGRRTGRALISIASGIGDIVRVTPLIRVAHQLGYEVDVLLSPDEPTTAELLQGAPEISRIITCASVLAGRTVPRISELAGVCYDVATFTTWSAPLAKFIDARIHHTFERNEWTTGGDIACVKSVARALGWEAPVPAPFVVKSERRFDLPPDTIALHPGCKPNWPWKKWHGFDELAAFFPNVAIVGTRADLDNSRTYFNRPYAWPENAHDFTGQLNLRDTAALISQCAALISVDSGLMHVGVALGVRTFGIFGLTSPARECIPSPLMTPITKQLPCEPACRRSAWGRQDCERHLECLKMLTAEEVVARVNASLSKRIGLRPESPIAPVSAPIRVNYYGEVSDASGYGQAARAYIHALHAAGVRVSVVNTSGRTQRIDDNLVASLIGGDREADFNILHGIPPWWQRAAHSMHNVIAITVWETDRMPQSWRNPLSHALDVWLPCTFNVNVFARDLRKVPFRLPHPIPVRVGVDEQQDEKVAAALGISPDAYVFYSIFEWQERKHPRGLIEAYLRAFPEATDAVLFVKTNEGAARDARRTLEQLRELTKSRGRVILKCAPLDDAQLRVLQGRGDCYVSLHKGEGWGYPLFEAASAGKPIVATAYAGPLDYLDSQRHWLVRYKLAPVRQPYAFYHSSMKWAEPDLEHAREGLRWVYEHRAEAATAAAEAARKLRTTYSLESIGKNAKARLTELEQRIRKPDQVVTVSQQRRSQSSTALLRRNNAMVTRQQALSAPTTLPIPGDWYDADYFERGLKSNWSRGYAWASFSGLFTETAAFLHELFPESASYIDAGCAKGFLVRALRERGLDSRGFDHSSWAMVHAEDSVKTFLKLANADTVEYDDRGTDILVAMSLFESLTEQQIRDFLRRARRWVRRALFATIPIQTGDRDRDLSHITMRDRRWWCERFVEAGWREDPLHQTFEQHPLPTKMQWNVFVFTPGA